MALLVEVGPLSFLSTHPEDGAILGGDQRLGIIVVLKSSQNLGHWIELFAVDTVGFWTVFVEGDILVFVSLMLELF